MRVILVGVCALLAWPLIAQSPGKQRTIESPDKYAGERPACKSLPIMADLARRFHDAKLTEQDKDLIRDRSRFVDFSNELVRCSELASGDEKNDALAAGYALSLARVSYLESRERGLVGAYNDLAASYNALTADYDNLLETAKRVVLAERKNAEPRFPWFTMPRPVATPRIQGPVVCSGDSIELGQGMTNFHVNCHE